MLSSRRNPLKDYEHREYGNALYSSPKSAYFGNPLLAHAFRPPSDRDKKTYLWIIRATGCLPFVVIVLASLANYPGLAFLRCPNKPRASHMNWKPWPLRLVFLSFIMTSTIALLVTIIILARISNLPYHDKFSKSP